MFSTYEKVLSTVNLRRYIAWCNFPPVSRAASARRKSSCLTKSATRRVIFRGQSASLAICGWLIDWSIFLSHLGLVSTRCSRKVARDPTARGALVSGSSAMGTATRLENGHATIRGILCLRHRQQPGPERGKTGIYRVFLKKVLHKREEKMQEKMKMA